MTPACAVRCIER